MPAMNSTALVTAFLGLGIGIAGDEVAQTRRTQGSDRPPQAARDGLVVFAYHARRTLPH